MQRAASAAMVVVAFLSWACAPSGQEAATRQGGDETVPVGETSPPAPVDPCAGLVPTVVTPPVQKVVSEGPKRYCHDLAVDAAGNVAVGFGGIGPHVSHVLSSGGDELGQLVGASRVIGQAFGFVGLTYGDTSWDLYKVAGWSASGEMGATTQLPGNMSRIFPAETGGAVVISGDRYPCPVGAQDPSPLFVSRVAADGAVLTTVDVGGIGCTGATALSDAQNNTLVVSNFGATDALGHLTEPWVGRWVSATGVLLTPWFDLGSRNPTRLLPLSGGGVALVDEAGAFAALPSGSASLASAPRFLHQSTGVEGITTVGDGRGYAVVRIPAAGWATELDIELYATSGERCGQVRVPGTTFAVAFGRDGTVAAIGPTEGDGCTVSWWPRLLP